MITERYKADAVVMGQKVKFATILFGKPYFWMEDGDGTTYLVKAKRQTDGDTYTNSWVPDFS